VTGDDIAVDSRKRRECAQRIFIKFFSRNACGNRRFVTIGSGVFIARTRCARTLGVTEVTSSALIATLVTVKATIRTLTITTIARETARITRIAIEAARTLTALATITILRRTEIAIGTIKTTSYALITTLITVKAAILTLTITTIVTIFSVAPRKTVAPVAAV